MYKIYMDEIYCEDIESADLSYKNGATIYNVKLHSLEVHDAEVRKAAIEETIRRIMCDAVPYRCVAPHGNEDEAVEAVDIGTIVKIEKELIENGRKDD